MNHHRKALLEAVGVMVAAALFLSPGTPRAGEEKVTPGAKSERPLFPRRPSVKGMNLKVSPNGRYFVDQDGNPSSTSATPAGCSSSA
jgi:hypothetical protein